MALIFKFQAIRSLIFYRGDDNPPSTRPLCPCDRHTRNNIIPICQSILQYRIGLLTPSDKPMWVNHQVVDIVNLQKREKFIKIAYKIMDTTLPLQFHAE